MHILTERIKYTKVYLQSFSDTHETVSGSVPSDEPFMPSENQERFLKKLSDELGKKKEATRDEIQQIVFDVLKKGNYKPKEVFRAFYRKLIGSDFGPKAADLILKIGTENTINKLLE